MKQGDGCFKKFCLTLLDLYLLIASSFIILIIILLGLFILYKNIIFMIILAGVLVFMSVYIIFCGFALVFKGADLFKKRTLLGYIFGYLGGFLGIVVIFSTLYTLSHAFQLGSLTINDPKFEMIKGFKELYFASLSFLSMNFGEIIPQKFDRILVTLNVLVGTLYSVVYVGYIFMSQTSRKRK
jgi:hypothetical protein